MTSRPCKTAVSGNNVPVPDWSRFHGYPDRQNDLDETPEHRTAQWLVRRDSGSMTPLVLVPPGNRAIHSLWGPGGERFYYHRKTVPGWVPTSLCSVDRDGSDVRAYYETSEHRLGHCCPSPGERWLVSDSQDRPENILILTHLERDEQHMLCWPNTSVKRPDHSTRPTGFPVHTDTDIHPNFSCSGKMIAFNSDATGCSHVYIVPVDDLVREGE
jgi:hypothetical protein